MNKELIDTVVTRYAEEIKKKYGSKLYQVILYGSCARGDYDNESDIDIMVLLNVPQEQVKYERKEARTVANNLDKEFGFNVLIMPTVQSREHFKKYENVLPLFSNINKEGIFYAGL